MTSHSFATLTKALGLGKSRKDSRPPRLRTSLSHSSLFSPNTDTHDLSGSPSPRSAPPTRSTLRHSKSTNNFFALSRTWTRSRQRRHHTADHDRNSHFSAHSPTTPIPPNGPSKFTLERRSTSSTASSSRTVYTAYTHYTTTHTANESLPHSPLPAQIWPCLVWDPSADPEDIDLGLDDDEDDNDNRPVFAEFFQRMRDLEAELDLIEARDGLQN